jgi:hypothetical protein
MTMKAPEPVEKFVVVYGSCPNTIKEIWKRHGVME